MIACVAVFSVSFREEPRRSRAKAWREEKRYLYPRALARLLVRLPERKKMENIAMQASKMAPSQGEKKIA